MDNRHVTLLVKRSRTLMKYLTTFLGILLLTTFMTKANGRQADKPAAAGRTLKVNVHYTGSIPVDDTHKVFVFLFSSTEFMQGNGSPIATQATALKDDTLTFSDLTDSPVYLAVVIDPSGTYNAQSQPPAGSSTAVYGKEPNVPDPINIEPGKTSEISITFDDTHRMRY